MDIFSPSLPKAFWICVLTVLTMNYPVLADTFKTSDGVIIDYETKGQGDPFLLLHSGMMSRDDLRLQIDYFSKHFKVIALDSREQGRSSASEEQITYDLMARDAVQLLDHLNIEQTYIFGHSDGGITALMMSVKYPRRLKNLIIHGAVFNHTGYDQVFKNYMKTIKWDSTNKNDTDPMNFPGLSIESYLLGRDNLSNFEEHLQEMTSMWISSPNLTADDLKKISIPVLIIVGDHNDISLRHSIEMHEGIKNSQLFIAPGASHYLHQEKPELLHQIIMEFLKN